MSSWLQRWQIGSVNWQRVQMPTLYKLTADDSGLLTA